MLIKLMYFNQFLNSLQCQFTAQIDLGSLENVIIQSVMGIDQSERTLSYCDLKLSLLFSTSE